MLLTEEIHGPEAKGPSLRWAILHKLGCGGVQPAVLAAAECGGVSHDHGTTLNMIGPLFGPGPLALGAPVLGARC